MKNLTILVAIALISAPALASAEIIRATPFDKAALFRAGMFSEADLDKSIVPAPPRDEHPQLTLSPRMLNAIRIGGDQGR